MSNHSDNASNTIASTVRTNSSLMTNPRLAVLSNSLNGVIAYSSTALESPFSTDKKNHRWLSMIFFLLGVLVIFRLAHG